MHKPSADLSWDQVPGTPTPAAAVEGEAYVVAPPEGVAEVVGAPEEVGPPESWFGRQPARAMRVSRVPADRLRVADTPLCPMCLNLGLVFMAGPFAWCLLPLQHHEGPSARVRH